MATTALDGLVGIDLSPTVGATFAGALLAMQGTLIALHERERSGPGSTRRRHTIQGMMAQDPWSYFMKLLDYRVSQCLHRNGTALAGNRIPDSWLTFGLLNSIRDRWWTMMLEAVRGRTVAEWQEVFERGGDVFAEPYIDGLELFGTSASRPRRPRR